MSRWKEDGLFSSRSNEWATPFALFDTLNEEFSFDCDVAASLWNAKCDRYLTPEDDALSLPFWPGESCWCNPPYGRDISKWMAKCLEESMLGKRVVALVFARTDTLWFHNFIANQADEVRFIRGRLSFVREDGHTGSAPCGSMVVVWHPTPMKMGTHYTTMERP